MSKRSKSKSYPNGRQTGRKWEVPRKWRSRKTRQPAKPQQQRDWMDDFLDTQMVLIGGAK